MKIFSPICYCCCCCCCCCCCYINLRLSKNGKRKREYEIYAQKYLNMRELSNYFVEACIDCELYIGIESIRLYTCACTRTCVEIYRISSSVIVISHRSRRHSHFWLVMYMQALYMYFVSFFLFSVCSSLSR